MNIELLEEQSTSLRAGWLSPGRQRLMLLVGCLLLSCLWISYVPLTGIDEIRNTEASREMLVSGNYLIPHFNGEPRYQKPILFYWVQSTSMRAFGVNEVAARLPSALAYLAAVLLLHAFLLRWLPHTLSGRRAALLGAAALATMPLFVIWSRSAVTDVMLTFFVTASILSLLHADLLHATDPAARAGRWYLLAAVAAALAALTKGLIGVGIPALVWLVYHLSRRNLRDEARRAPWALTIGVFLAVAVPWYAATYFVDGPGFLTHFFIKEHLGRFTTMQEGHGASNFLLGLLPYFPIALVALFPYSAFLLRELLAPFGGDNRLREDAVTARLRRFGWTWVWTVIIFFSLSRTQLPSYIQSIAPGAALLFAIHALGRSSAEGAVGRRARWAAILETAILVLLTVAIAAGLPWVLLTHNPPGDRPWAAPYAQPAAAIVVGLLILAGLLLLWAIRGRNRIPRVMAAWTVVLAVLLFGAAPLHIRAVFNPIAEVGRSLRNVPRDEAIISYYGTAPEEAVFYSRHQVRFLSEKKPASLDALKARVADGESFMLLTDEEGLWRVRAFAVPFEIRRFPKLLVARIEPPYIMGE